MSLQEDAQAAVDAANKVLSEVTDNQQDQDPEFAIVTSVVSALQNAGYTVTPPTDGATQITVQDGDSAPLE